MTKKETNDVISDIRCTNIKYIQETDDNLDWSILLKYIGFYEVKVFKNYLGKNNNKKTINKIFCSFPLVFADVWLAINITDNH